MIKLPTVWMLCSSELLKIPHFSSALFFSCMIDFYPFAFDRLNPFNTDASSASATARANANVEVASEVCEELDYKTNASSPSEPESEASTWRRRDLVSMVTFRLTMVELIRQNRGPVSAIRVQVAAVSCDECGAIPWDEFQVQKNLYLLYSHFSIKFDTSKAKLSNRKCQAIHEVIKKSPNTS